MIKTAFVFPGQGAQTVGMAKDAYDHLGEASSLFRTADEVLGFPLSDLIFNGPDEELKKTFNTQPALLTASLALLQVVRAHTDITPDYVAGHSLGEYSALVAAGSLTFTEAVAVVRSRGLFMEEAVPNGEGAMAAVLGAEREALEELCQQITAEGHLVQPANLNCPGQIVISGTEQGVQAVVERGKQIGAKRVLKLEVSGPFHSQLMAPASNRLVETLNNINIATPNIPVIANVTARPATEPSQIRDLLVRQVSSSVLWEDSIRYLIANGVTRFIEIGPGNVLSGLIKKIDSTVQTISLQSVESILTFSSEVKS